MHIFHLAVLFVFQCKFTAQIKKKKTHYNSACPSVFLYCPQLIWLSVCGLNGSWYSSKTMKEVLFQLDELNCTEKSVYCLQCSILQLTGHLSVRHLLALKSTIEYTLFVIVH